MQAHELFAFWKRRSFLKWYPRCKNKIIGNQSSWKLLQVVACLPCLNII